MNLIPILVLGAFWCLGCQAPQEAESDRAFSQGVDHLHAGRWEEAGERFQRTLQLAPDSTLARIRLGEVYLKQARIAAAEHVLAQLAPAARQRPEARILQARILSFKGRAAEAEEIGEEVIGEYPRSLDARLLLARVGLDASVTMNLHRTRDLCREILEEHPAHYEAGVMLLKAVVRLGDFDQALALGQQFMATYPEDCELHILSAGAAVWGKHPVAAEILQRAVDLSLSHYPNRLKALWLLKLAFEPRGGYPEDLPERYRFHSSKLSHLPVDVKFTDIAVAAGVDKIDRGRGSSWLDFDGDGDLDLFSVGIQVPHSLYRNDGRGGFQDVAPRLGLADERGGWGASRADFDNDGDPDLYVTRDAWEGGVPNSLYRNDRGAFVDIAEEAGAADPGASFTATWGDYDLDGYLDLHVANGVPGDGGPNNLLHNEKNGTFISVASQAGVADTGKTIGSAFGDYDGDGAPDLYVVNIGGPNRLYHNDGDGTFIDVAGQAGVRFPLEGGYVTFFFDYNNDGHLDIFAATMSAFEDVLNSMVEGQAIEPNRPFLYHNNGDGTFTDVAVPAGLALSFGTMGIGVGDVNNDGFPDIYLANGGPKMYRLEPNNLFLNQGDGRFVDITETAGVGNLGKGHGSTFADFDGDGDLDLYAGLGGHYDGDVWPNSLYRNDGAHGRYLEVETVGTTSNRDGIGARVAAFSGARRVYGEVASGFGFGSSNAPSLHLGLGPESRVDRLEIRWPSGRRQTWKDVPADCTIRITEGETQYEIVRRQP